MSKLFGEFHVTPIGSAIKDAQALFPKFRDYQELRRHALKLAFWPDRKSVSGQVADLDWEEITGMAKPRAHELRIDDEIGGFNNLRIIFYPFELMTITKSKDRMSTRDVVSDVLTENIKLYVAIRNAYDQCDPEIQAVVDCMIRIWNNEESTEDERKRAIHTITDAIFPGESVNMLDDCGRLAKRDPHGHNEQMIEEEQTFAQRLSAFLTEKEMTQEQLASAIGVGQSAISNMLNRQCRPQRKTVARIAAALGIEPAELWSSND